jgi:hypothetical protein
MKFAGRILYDDGTEIAPVTGEYLTRDAKTGKSWRGHCVVPAGKVIVPGNCRLVLNDGREARIVVDSITAGSSQCTIAFFRGSGPWP